MRSASRAVNSRCGVLSAAAASAAVGGGSPSTVSPMSCGRRRNTVASGQPITIASTPEPKAVVRQPRCRIDQATTGTRMPPSARPSPDIDSARARLRSNQWMIAMFSGK